MAQGLSDVSAISENVSVKHQQQAALDGDIPKASVGRFLWLWTDVDNVFMAVEKN